MPFHIRRTLGGEDRDETKLGATRAFLADRILAPYASGDQITLKVASHVWWKS